MNDKKLQLAVIIGRVQPPHSAHFDLFNAGLAAAEHIVILLGSHNTPRTIKNPWNSSEREAMIRANYPENMQERIHIIGMEDSIYDDPDWVTRANIGVNVLFTKLFGTKPVKNDIGVVCYKKDESTYYLNYFKNWKTIDATGTLAAPDGPHLSATKVRELYFEGYMSVISALCPKPVCDLLNDFRKTEVFVELKKEYDDAVAYDAQYATVPYGQVNFVTTDAMVVQSGHILLIKRKNSPGKGLWALPGGHLNVNETFLEGALRELDEETSISVPHKVLKGSLVYDNVFDHPDRSLRGRVKTKIGRTITRLFVFKLDDAAELPRVVAGDDAAKAWWFTFDEIQNMQNQLFEDHYSLIATGIGRL